MDVQKQTAAMVFGDRLTGLDTRIMELMPGGLGSGISLGCLFDFPIAVHLSAMQSAQDDVRALPRLCPKLCRQC